MKKVRVTAWLTVLLMLLSAFGPMAQAVPIADPMDAELSGVPSVWFEEHPEWAEVYLRSWEIHKDKINRIGVGCNPEEPYYVKASYRQ